MKIAEIKKNESGSYTIVFGEKYPKSWSMVKVKNLDDLIEVFEFISDQKEKEHES